MMLGGLPACLKVGRSAALMQEAGCESRVNCFPAAVVRPAGLPRSRTTSSRCAVGLQGASSGVPCSFPSRAARGFAADSLLDFRAGLRLRPFFRGRVA
jgi:hypothetical protein